MNRIYFFFIICLAGIVGTIFTFLLGHWACFLGTIIFIPAIALSLDTYFRSRREDREKLYARVMEKESSISDYIRHFGLDRNRAEMLYNAGFKNLDDLKDRSVEELMQIDEINPTMAERIVRKIKENRIK